LNIKHYHIINLILSGVILLIFIYSAAFSPEKGNYPVKSSYEKITGQPTLSTGMSRAFSSIVRFNFDEALNYNRFSIRIFIFFLVQFFMRIFILLTTRNNLFGEVKYIVIPDAIISAVMLLIFFEPFWRELFYI